MIRLKNFGFSSYGTAILLAVVLAVALYVVPEFFRIQRNIHKLSCRTIVRDIQSSLEEFNMSNPGYRWVPKKDVDIKMLLEANCLDFVPVCPDGGIYRINESGVVYCTYHQPAMED